MIVAFVLVGCGVTSDNGGIGNFVFTGSSIPNDATTGSMTFNFVKAQSPLEVPANTTDIRFRFYSAIVDNGTLIQDETHSFAASITVDPGHGSMQSVVITALSADGYPVLESTVDVADLSGEDVTLDFTDATTEFVTQGALRIDPPAANIVAGGPQQFTAYPSFSNGQVLPANNVLWSATGQASVDLDTGLVTAETNGAATVTATETQTQRRQTSSWETDLS